MAKGIDERLQRLRNRRSDPTEITAAYRAEDFEKRGTGRAVTYVLGAMQEVEPRYTQISREEGQRVEKCLSEGLGQVGIIAEFRLQGSVPLNVHIRGVSDVDLLVIESRYLKCEFCLDGRITYTPYTGLGTIVDDVLHLRSRSEEILKRRYWGADIDYTRAKSIRLSGGSFRRDVDVVPASWFDTAAYQRSLSSAERGIDIVDKITRSAITNFPFLYMEHINSKAEKTAGGLKKAIRLLKNIRNDCDEDIALTSYDIGSLLFHCPQNLITSYPGADLFILTGCDEWIDSLLSNPSISKTLQTPDGTRLIFDDSKKWKSLSVLQREVSDLMTNVEREISGPYRYAPIAKSETRRRLNDHKIPGLELRSLLTYPR